MQTIEEYKAYTRQLEAEVGSYHHAYDAVVIERNALVRNLMKYENPVSVECAVIDSDTVTVSRKVFESMTKELEELRKHELELDLSKARINELEAELKEMAINIDHLETELEQSKGEK